MRFFLAASQATRTNDALLEAVRRLGLEAAGTRPEQVLAQALPGDVVLARLDVRPSLDGVEDGLWELGRLEHDGVCVLNRPSSLLAAHDKLATALRLARAGIPHPRTAHVDHEGQLADLAPPVVVKPRFGSWGHDVMLCESREALASCFRDLRGRTWFRRQGAIVQELVPPRGYDLRVVVAAGEIVGAVERRAVPGEWRTNIALGGRRRPVEPEAGARLAALTAAAALGGDLVGVDLLPLPTGGYVVLEANGAVDFTEDYSLVGRDVFEDAATALLRTVGEVPAIAAGFSGAVA
jgi:RimK family alpha-L-glutamate ligase